MNKAIIKKIIGERQAEISTFKLIKRDVKFDPTSNYVLIGARRAGKTHLLYQEMLNKIENGAKPEDFLYINFEDERLSFIKAQELGIFLDAYQEMFGNKKPFIYLDEIQNIDGWEKFARRLADSKYRVMITGSNAKMLSAEISTTLGGRFVPKEIYPFSFNEFLEYKGISLDKNWEYTPKTRNSVAKLFDEYFYYGGFAESFDKTDKREWINSLYQKTLMGDIVERNSIRNPRIFRLLAHKLADSVMQPSTLKRLQNIINSTGEKISMPILKDYLGYMEQAYLTFSVSNLVSPITDQTTIQKRYFVDNGILNLFLLNGETKLLENIVAIHLNKLYRNTQEEQRLFYYNSNVEVDFCIPEKKLAIQVSYSIDNYETYEREVNGLAKFIKANDGYKGLIITRDHEETININGIEIEITPIWKWLCRE